ncbi:MAG TPA: sugar phosphate isomerase/epimerase family protein [Planctomycetota bacterium]|nr:sugar phosphate isomerase/epimerase family protein [Planctomycetota bacterium]
MNRRDFLGAAGTLSAWPALTPERSGAVGPAPARPDEPKFRLGTITYNIGDKWDLSTLLAACKAARYEYVELRTTHAHRVEPDLSPEKRQEVHRQFEDSGVRLWSYGTVCEFQSPDPAVVQKQIEDCRAFCKLAADTGARGVKVRPNGLPKGAEPARVLEQIGRALRECGRAAEDAGVEIWVEVHGPGTQLAENMRSILDHCGHRSVGICWNSNATDVKDGSVQAAFDLLKKDLRSCHINELWSGYPYRELFGLFRSTGYDRVTFMEVPGVPEAPGAKQPDAAIRFMKYYRALWTELSR